MNLATEALNWKQTALRWTVNLIGRFSAWAWNAAASTPEKIERFAKPFAFLLAAVGLIAIYIPSARRAWEKLTLPAAWYQIGTIERRADGKQYTFVANSYDSSAWSEGVFSPRLLFSLPGKYVLTDDTAVGRVDAYTNADIVTVLPAHECLYVRDLAFTRFVPPPGPRGSSVRLKDLPRTSADWREMMDSVRMPARVSDSDCQPLTRDEYERVQRNRSKAGDPLLPSYRRASVCSRIAVWVKAKKLTC